MRRNKGAIVFFLLPPLILYIVFFLYPVFKTLYLAFFRWRGYSGQKTFIGLSNFLELLHDPLFIRSLMNNMIAVAVVIVGTLPVALALAQALASKIRGSSFFRSTLLFPNFLGAAFVGVLWLFIYDPTIGLVNGIFKFMGFGGRAWLGESTTALVALTASLIWSRLGFYILLFLGAINNIPPQIYDAAKVDGVSKWQEFRYITLPLIKPSIGVALVFMVAWSFNALFAIINVTTEGGPAYATEIVPTFLVKQAFEYSRFGYGSAGGVMMIIMLFILATFIVQSLMRGVTRGGRVT